MKILISILIFLSVINYYEFQTIFWQPYDWAFSCYFKGNTFEVINPIEGKNCGPTCENTLNCTHFNWAPYHNGSCYLKKGKIKKEDALHSIDNTVLCGFIASKLNKTIDLYATNISNAKWKSNSTGDIFISFNDSYIEWAQFNKNTLVAKFKLVKYENASITLYDKDHDMTVRISSDGYIFSSNQYSPVSGEWEIKPKIFDKIQSNPEKHETNENPIIKSITETKYQDINQEIMNNKKNKTDKSFKLSSGKFTIKLSIKPVDNSVDSIHIRLGQLKFILTDDTINLDQDNNRNAYLQSIKKIVLKKPEFELIHFKSSIKTLWIKVFSFDRIKPKNNFIRFGFGYKYSENIICEFIPESFSVISAFKTIDEISIDENLKVINTKIDSTVQFRDASFLVYDDSETLSDENYNIVTLSNLETELNSLNQLIDSDMISLDSEQISSLAYSIENENCLLNSKLKEKAEKYSLDIKNTFIKIKSNLSESQLTYLEILPRDHYLPIHNHSDAFGIIKMLEGSLRFDFYNPINEIQYESEASKAIKTFYLNKNKTTWLNSEFYQTHLVKNENSSVAISIQAYTAYKNNQIFFIDPNEDNQLFINSVSDLTLEKLLEITMKEYKRKSCVEVSVKKNCCTYTGPVCGHVLAENEECKNRDQIESDAIYTCTNGKNSYKMSENCDEICLQEKSNTRCASKNIAQVKLSAGIWSNVSGTLNLMQESYNTVKITGEIVGLSSNTKHGLHIHESGDLSNDCNEIGRHFNPFSAKLHGDLGDNMNEKHSGDLGNIETDENGKARVNKVVKNHVISLIESEKLSILNRAFAVHQYEDDIGRNQNELSKKNGNAGPIVSCGLIKKVDSMKKNTKQTYNAKWVQSNDESTYIVNKINSDVWEMYDNKKLFLKLKLELHEYDNNVILVDEENTFRLILSDDHLVIWKEDEGEMYTINGYWEIKPKKYEKIFINERKTPKLIKWVSSNRKITIEDNSNLWTEYNGKKMATRLYFIKKLDEDVILYNEKKNLFYKLTSDSLFNGLKSDKTVQFITNGKWIVE